MAEQHAHSILLNYVFETNEKFGIFCQLNGVSHWGAESMWNYYTNIFYESNTIF